MPGIGRIIVAALALIVIALTKTGRKRGRFVVRVEMGNVAIGTHAKNGNALAPFLRDKASD